MNEQIQAHFDTLQSSLGPTDIAAGRKQMISDIIQKLPDLYSLYRETNSSRYGTEIGRLTQAILREITNDPMARKLEVEFREGLHRLHEEFGIPKLLLKGPTITKSKKPAKA